MERPRKRPRLSMFTKQAPDAELDHARFLNDLSLKSRFEAIFEKYSQDFSEIGDEISIHTGELVVNNGHIESMETETDTGEHGTPLEAIPAAHRVTGKSLLRAMTVAPEIEDTDDEYSASDDVVMSIETMAKNAARLANQYFDDSKDDLFATTQSVARTMTPEIKLEEGEIIHSMLHPVPNYSSDEDSLLNEDGGRDDDDGQNSERSESPDSLFEVAQHNSNSSEAQRVENSTSSACIRPGTGTEVDLETDLDLSDEAILDKFGPAVGHQVLGLLELRSKPSDSHVEEAWRVPVDIGPARSSEQKSTPFVGASTPLIASSKERELSELSEDHGVSLWGKQPRPKPKRKRQRRRKPIVQRVHTPDGYRDESEDPLQEDFGHRARRTLFKKLSECAEEVELSEKELGNPSSQTGPASWEDGDSGLDGLDQSAEEEEAADRDDDDNDDDGDDDSGNVSVMDNDVEERDFAQHDDAQNESDQGDTIVVVRHGYTPKEPRSKPKPKHRTDDAPETGSDGVCPYCKHEFSTKSSMMAHWDRLIQKATSRIAADDPHDMDFIRAARRHKSTRNRCPRLTQEDFRTMVELHEGGGLSFDEIVGSQVLRTHKTSGQLRNLYDRHRSVHGADDLDSAAIKPWTAEEDQCLQHLCRNRLVTMATLKRRLKDRDEIEIGNRLAECWLRILRRNNGEYDRSWELELESDRRAEPNGGAGSERATGSDSDGAAESDSDEEATQKLMQQWGVPHSSKSKQVSRRVSTLNGRAK